MSTILGLTLLRGAREGDLYTVKMFHKRGADVDYTDKAKNTPLMFAAGRGHLSVARYLLAHGADLRKKNAAGETALDLARRGGHTLLIVELEEAQTTTPDEWAAIARGMDMVQNAYFGSSLLKIVEEAHIDRIRNTARPESVNYTEGADRFRALHLAARRGRTDVVQLLVEVGARVNDVDARGRTPLHWASQSGVAACVEYLVTQASAHVQIVDESGHTAMDYCFEKGDVASARVLLANGAKLEAANKSDVRLINLAITEGDVDIVRELCRQGVRLASLSDDDQTILHRAVLSDNADLVEFLVDENLDVNVTDACGWTPLHHAIVRGNLQVCQKFLGAGASINTLTRSRPNDPSENDPQSTLELAAERGHNEIISLLLAHNDIEIDIRNGHGRTPLISAAAKGRAVVVKQLLDAGAEVDARGDAGETALIMATLGSFAKAVHVLLEHGARTDIASNSGKTPLTVAKSRELRDLLQLYHNSQQFHDKTFKLINDPNANPTITELTELVPLITSVYDLRIVLTLVGMIKNASVEAERSSESFRGLVKDCFTHVVTRRLTYDDEACVFFKMALEHCEREGLLPRSDVLLLDRQAEKVNTESADWVMEMKKQVYVNSWRLDKHDQHLHAVVTGLKEVYATVMENRKVLVTVSRRVGGLQKQVHEGKKLMAQLRKSVSHMAKDMSLFESRLNHSEANIEKVASSLKSFRETYVERLRQEERNQKIKRVCGIVASVAGFVFAPVLKEVADAVVDFVNPIDIVEKVYGEHDIARFLSDGSEKALPKVIQEQLEKYAIPQDDFETLLREEIVLQHPEYVSECEKRGLSVSVDGGQSDVARSVEPILDTEEVALLKLVGELQSALGDAVASSLSGGRTKASTSTDASAPARLNVTVPARSVASGESFAPSSPPRSPSSLPARPPSSPVSRREVKLEFNSNAGAPTTAKTTPEVSGPAVTPPTTEASKISVEIQDVSALSSEEASVAFVDDLESFHYHMAVHESRGELSEFTELVEMIDDAACDPNATMKVELVSVSKSRVALCAAEYAYRRGFEQVGDMLSSRMQNPPQFEKTVASSVELLEDVEDYPFFYAVDESHGDVDECEHFLELVDEADHPLDAIVEADVVYGTHQSMQWSAVEYACHLGYVEVVKFMLNGALKGSLSMKTKFQLLKLARERNATLAAVQNTRIGESHLAEFEPEAEDVGANNDTHELKQRDDMHAAAKNKEKGNELFKDGYYDEAAKRYAEALSHAFALSDLNGNGTAEVDKLKLSLYLNLAQCHLKLEEWPQAINKCRDALALDPTNPKALYRRALALEKEEEIEAAVQDVKEALRHAPGDKAIRTLDARLQVVLKRQVDTEKKMWSKAFL